MPSVYTLPAHGSYAACAYSSGRYWPSGLLQEFTLRMASHGHSVSGSMMIGDHDYATQQLAHAHCMADGHLRDLAMALFHHFENH